MALALLPEFPHPDLSNEQCRTRPSSPAPILINPVPLTLVWLESSVSAKTFAQVGFLREMGGGGGGGGGCLRLGGVWGAGGEGVG